MHLQRHSSNAWEVSGIHPFFAGLLAEVPQAAARHEGVRGRLYPDPVGGPEGGGDLREVWREHVTPELERLFASSREIVARDLDSLGPSGEGVRLLIPDAHVDAWLNALNQARLVIAGENNFREKDMDHAEPPDLSTPRGVDLLRVHFYAHLQELLVEASG